MTTQLNLDVETPEQVAIVLRRAATAYAASAADLRSAHQDSNAGRPWERIARALDLTAIRVEQIINQEGLGR